MSLLNSFLRIIWNGVFNITGMDISFDIEFRDFSFYLVELKADYLSLKKRFEHRGLLPVETSPGQAKIQISCLDLRDVQFFESYREMSIHVPVESLEGRKNSTFFHLYLPVTSEEARWGGVDVNGFPKFIASIDIFRGDDFTECKLSLDEGYVLGYGVENRVGSFGELAWDIYGVRKGKLTRTSFEFKGNIYVKDEVEGSRICFGEHSMSRELEALLVSDEVQKIMIGNDLYGTLKKPVIIYTNNSTKNN